MFKFVRTYATKPSFFKLFPKTFPQGGPPGDSFHINQNKLRKEYRNLQSLNHPDISQEQTKSIDINKAFTVLKNPYLRLSHFIYLNSPEHFDIQDDAISKEQIRKYQQSSTDNSNKYKEMLLQVMEAHEQLEFAESESALEDLEIENSKRIETTENEVQEKLSSGDLNSMDWDGLMMDAIKLKYWTNIQNGIKEWQPGKPVLMTH